MENSRIKEIINELPENYLKVLKKDIESAILIFNDNLINITLGGSGGKGNVIEGWSDLDLYIILNKYNPKQITEYMSIVNNNSIHTGTTFYTLAEIDNNVIDLKTKVMLYERKCFNVNPTLYGIDVFKEVDYEEIKNNDKANFPSVLHDVRRRFIELCMGKELDKVYVKKLLVLVKCLLRSYDIFTYGYAYTFNKLFEFFNEQNICLTEIKDFDIVKIINNMDDSKEDIIIFSNYLLNYISDVYNKGGLRKKKGLVLER